MIIYVANLMCPDCGNEQIKQDGRLVTGNNEVNIGYECVSCGASLLLIVDGAEIDWDLVREGDNAET